MIYRSIGAEGGRSCRVQHFRSHVARHHVYMTEDSRINVAGLRRENLDYFADWVAQVL